MYSIILPCGNNVCEEHLERKENDSRIYKCNFCTENHQTPENKLIVLDPNIVNSDQSNQFIKLCKFYTKTEFKLHYRASRDGFSSKAFHSKCDRIPKTLSMIKVKDKPHIFGGYTSHSGILFKNTKKIQMHLYLVW
jgi:hypothetical protein